MIELSIVIATYNRGARLERMLRSLACQTVVPSRWEAVVVDNNSTDDTAEVFAAFAVKHPELNLRLTTERNQGLSWARNRGILESTGAIIAIIDDDEEVNAGFVESYLDFFARHPSAAMAGGRVVPRYEVQRPRWMTRWTERPIAGTFDGGAVERPFRSGGDFVRRSTCGCGCGDKTVGAVKGLRGYPAGGNMAVRREAIERYGAFDTSLGRTGGRLIGGEEKELFFRLTAAGEGVWYVPGAVIYHLIGPEKLTPDYFRRLARGVGASERVRVRGGSIAGAAPVPSDTSALPGSVDGHDDAVARGASSAVAPYVKALAAEGMKWAATLVLAFGYAVTMRFGKARYLLILRADITRGLLRG